MLRIRLLALVIGAVLLGLAAAAIATAGGEESATPGHNHAFGAGTFGPGCVVTHAGPFCTQFNYTVRLLGIQSGNGGEARGVMERRNNVNGGTFLGRVTCMTVDGNRAAIGGFFTRTPGQPGISDGDPFLLYVSDNGTLDGADGSDPDGISPLVALPVGDPDRELMPERFPEVCPAADSIYDYFPLTAGDITASDAQSGGEDS
jgi:hypothetical protein